MGRQRVAGATVEEPISDDINAWQAQVWKKPPLEEPRTWQGQTRDGKATRGRSYCGRSHTDWEHNAWQGKVWKKAWQPKEGRREPLNAKTSPRDSSKAQKTPSPPYNVPHTPLGIRRAGCVLLLCISQTPEMHPRPFFGGFWHPRWSFEGVVPHPRGHPRASAPALCTCGEPCQSPWTAFSFRRPFLLCWAPLRTFFLQ